VGELIERARNGSSASIVIRGEPGVGKSAVLEALVADAGEALVLQTQGLEVEAPLAFAALHRFLLPVMRLREELPVPQARALRVVFGEEDGPSIEPFLVAVATLSILTVAAEKHTVHASSRTRTGSTPRPQTRCCYARAGSAQTVCSWCSRPETGQ